MKLFSTVLGTILLSTGTHAQNSCPTDVTCPDGQTLNRVPTNDCKFSLCAGEKDCTSASSGTEENYLICPNGEQMPRDGFNNCEFEQCDINYRCESQDVQQCPAPYLHVYVALDPTAGAGGCQDFLPCPGSGTPENLPSSTSTVVTTSATPEVTSTTPEDTVDDVEMTCNRNGGSAMSYEGTCDERGYTWTEQCIVEEKDGKCVTTATECGCQVFMGDGVSTSIGSGSISGCDNACVSISDDVPEGGSCQKTGESISFNGRCDSRGYTYTSQCNFKEEVNDQNEVEQCTVSMASCGCLWWEEDSVDTAALHSKIKSCTDPCAVHGYPPLPSSAPLKAIIGTSSITFVTIAWLFYLMIVD